MTLHRRALLVFTAIATAALVLHVQLSSALVSRGDALAYSGSTSRALVMYERATWFDRDNGSAADRLAFAAMLSHDPSRLHDGVRIASGFLARHPGDGTLLMDRALCEQRLGTLAAAAKDFERAGRARRDPSAMMFAALDERRLARIERSHVLLEEALAFDPSFAPARQALAR